MGDYLETNAEFLAWLEGLLLGSAIGANQNAEFLAWLKAAENNNGIPAEWWGDPTVAATVR